MFRKKSIDEWALDYWLLQRYAKFCFRLYYRKVTIINRHYIPEKQPIILAPNHQNALMDAMVMVCTTEYQTVFLARADIFKGNFLIRVLTFMNIMPIYRIRDGYENVKRNDEVFVKTNQVLHNKLNPLCLFPEGNHGDKRRLRSLVKGLFRIAFMAQEDWGDKPGIKIIPIGIDYGHYQHFRTTVFVNIGQPIEVSDYYEAYKENPVQGINQLRDRYEAEEKKLMIDIQTEEYYDTYMALRTICNDQMRAMFHIRERTAEGRFKADKLMIRMLDRELGTGSETLPHLKELVSEYQKGLEKAGLRDWVLKKEIYSFTDSVISALAKILFLPLFLAGLVNNALPYWFSASRAGLMKDPQFRSSAKYVIGMITFPVWYLIIFIILSFVPLPSWIKLIYLLLMPATGIFAFNYYIGLKKLRSRFFYTRDVLKNNPAVMKLKEQRENILKIMSELVDRQILTDENIR